MHVRGNVQSVINPGLVKPIFRVLFSNNDWLDVHYPATTSYQIKNGHGILICVEMILLYEKEKTIE